MESGGKSSRVTGAVRRLIRVGRGMSFEKVLQTSDWTRKPQQSGRAKGFGFYFCHQGYFAEVVEASVTDGNIAVHQVWVAGDVGSQIVNPMGAENQVKGAIIDGLAQALAGQEIEFVDGCHPDRAICTTFHLARIGCHSADRDCLGQIREAAYGPRRAGIATGDSGADQRHFRHHGQPDPLATGSVEDGLAPRDPSGSRGSSRVHAGALGDLVDDLLVGSQAYAYDLRGFRIAVGHDGAIGRIMAGREHLFDVKRVAYAALQRPAMDVCHCLSVGREYDHRLYG